MRQTTINLSLLGSAFLILLSFHFFESLLMFLLVGELPGITRTLSPVAMAIIMTASGAVLIVGIAAQFVTIVPRSHDTTPLSKHQLTR